MFRCHKKAGGRLSSVVEIRLCEASERTAKQSATSSSGGSSAWWRSETQIFSTHFKPNTGLPSCKPSGSATIPGNKTRSRTCSKSREFHWFFLFQCWLVWFVGGFIMKIMNHKEIYITVFGSCFIYPWQESAVVIHTIIPATSINYCSYSLTNHKEWPQCGPKLLIWMPAELPGKLFSVHRNSSLHCAGLRKTNGVWT